MLYGSGSLVNYAGSADAPGPKTCISASAVDPASCCARQTPAYRPYPSRPKKSIGPIQSPRSPLLELAFHVLFFRFDRVWLRIRGALGLLGGAV